MSAKRKNTSKKSVISAIIAAVLLISLAITVAPKLEFSSDLPGWKEIFKNAELVTNDVYISETPLSVHYIDVGQGDCIIIKSDWCNILIDAGENGNEDNVISYLENLGIKTLDYVIVSHPHSDHIGSMAEVIEHFKVRNVIMPELTQENIPTTRVYENLLSAVSDSGAKSVYAVPGDIYKAGEISFEVFAPLQQYDDLNNMSDVIRLDYGETSFLFDGDASIESEKDMLKSGYDLDADVLKAGHHGSKYSSSAEFLRAVSPELVVISCGKDNSYGHPHEDTLKNIESVGAQVLRTDLAGTIVIGSDGETLSGNYENY